MLEKMAFNGFIFKQTSIAMTGIDPTITIHLSPQFIIFSGKKAHFKEKVAPPIAS